MLEWLRDKVLILGQRLRWECILWVLFLNGDLT